MAQLIDNHTLNTEKRKKTVIDYITNNISTNSRLNIVTGYVSASALVALKARINEKVKEFRIVIGEHATNEGKKNKGIDLLDAANSIEQSLHLTNTAKVAVEFLKQDKVQVKTLRPNFCHAKLYLADETNENIWSIIGSSNLTGSGIGLYENSNLELSMASSSEYNEAKSWFNNLWSREEAKDKVKDEHGKLITFKELLVKEISKLYHPYSPEEIYYKILFEMYNEMLGELDFDPSLKKQIKHLEQTVIWKTLFNYQQKGVLSIIRMMQNYNGAILADAVGLGKTFTALAVMKFHEMNGYKVLLICPKKLEENWKRYQSEMGSRFEQDEFLYKICYHTDMQRNGQTEEEGFRFDSKENGKIKKIIDNVALQKILVVIDESHNLRNDKSSRYKVLVESILQKKDEVKVLLLSATPINTKLTDFRNQVKLITRGFNNEFGKRDSTNGEPLYPKLYDHHKDLEVSFRQAQEQFKKWSGMPQPKRISDLVRMLGNSFFTLTDSLIIARTREMIGLIDKDLNFPSKEKPINVFIGDQSFGDFKNLQQLMEALDFTMSGYRPAHYIKAPKATNVLNDDDQRQTFLVKMMFILLAKRLESSWKAFEITLGRILEHHKSALSKINEFEASKTNAIIYDADDSDFSEIEDQLEDDSESNDSQNETPQTFTLGKKSPVNIADITDLDKFKEHLIKDIGKMQLVYNQFKIFNEVANRDAKADLKLKDLIERLEEKAKQPNKKVIIFTTFTDTANYLYDSLRNLGFTKIALVSGQEYKSYPAIAANSKRKFEPILEHFAPYTKLYMEKDWTSFYSKYNEGNKTSFEDWKKLIELYGTPSEKHALENEIDILIATDVLSEGQNLQDADTVINYDIHWNPVRLIQRLGRIDRINSPNEKVLGINYWPANHIEDYINLRKRVNERLALMLLAGVENINLNDELAAIVADNPLITDQHERFYKQMQETWDGIETGDQTFGLNDLSLETFRQELLAELEKNRNKYEAMPNGVFSGFKLDSVNELPDMELKEGIAALLAFPKRMPEVKDHSYSEFHLMIGGENPEFHKLTHFEILTLLRKNKIKPRYISDELDNVETAKPVLEKYKGWLQNWVEPKKEAMINDQINQIFAPNVNVAAITNQPAPNLRMQLDKLDLLAWMELNS